MNRRQRMLGGFLLLAIVSAVSAWLALQWRYPYGRSHCCIKSMLLALNLYAQEHQGRFPAGQRSPEASLSLLYKAKLIDADVLRGKTAKEEEVRALLDRGGLLGPESCGWHYVEGLNQSDDGRLALLWDKTGLGHYGERHRHAWREVLLVDGDIKWINSEHWASFQAEQDQLLKTRKLSVKSNGGPVKGGISEKARLARTNAQSRASGLDRDPNGRPSPTLMLAVKFHEQQHSLSCEAAALVMALRSQGVDVSEAEVISQTPFDPTPHVDDQWGDPDDAFVGSVDGIMPIDGYGIHWRPLAAVARHWRKAEVLEGASPQLLAQHIQAGRPVIVWGYSGLGGTQLWQTPKGKTVHALKGEHTRVVCGLRGPPSAPEGFYLMDPNCGLVYWPVRLLMSNWEPSGRAGVVIFAEPPPNSP